MTQVPNTGNQALDPLSTHLHSGGYVQSVQHGSTYFYDSNMNLL
jgi:hypothetical protein